MMDANKMQQIIADYTNGNISDFKKAVNKLNKHDFLELVLVMQADDVDLSNILNII